MLTLSSFNTPSSKTQPLRCVLLMRLPPAHHIRPRPICSLPVYSNRAAIKPRALRNARSANVAGHRPAGANNTAAGATTAVAPGSGNGGEAGGGGESPKPAAPSNKSNDDFRAMLTRK